MAAAQNDTSQQPVGLIELKYATFCLLQPDDEPYYGCLSSFCPSPSPTGEPLSFVDFSFHLFEEFALSRGHTAARAWVAHVGRHSIIFGHHASWLVAIAYLNTWLKLGCASPTSEDVAFYAIDPNEVEGHLGRVVELAREL